MKAFEGWYCAHCQRGVDASEVTFYEQHTVCGRTITDDVPPKASIKEPVTTERPEGESAAHESVATVKAERDALRAENAELRERVKELVGIIDDIRHWDISNLSLDIPLPLRKRMQKALAAMQEGE